MCVIKINFPFSSDSRITIKSQESIKSKRTFFFFPGHQRLCLCCYNCCYGNSNVSKLSRMSPLGQEPHTDVLVTKMTLQESMWLNPIIRVLLKSSAALNISCGWSRCDTLFLFSVAVRQKAAVYSFIFS